MKYVQNIFERDICVRSKFSSVRSSHGLCARAHMHSLEGTLVINWMDLGVDQHNA